MHLNSISVVRLFDRTQDPDGEIENSGKSIFEIRIPNFCYIQVIVFGLSYQLVAAVGAERVRYHEKCGKHFLYLSKDFAIRCHWQIAHVINYNLNVTEFRDLDFKNAFSEFSISPSGSYLKKQYWRTNMRSILTTIGT